jgi:hypothetical protein
MANIITKELASSDKYIFALKFINKLLENMNKNQIDDITHFKEIDREDIILPINIQTLSEMTDEITEYFDKLKCGLYNASSKSVVLNCLRGMMKQMGYELYHKRRDITININGVNYRKTRLFYSIK